MSAKSKRRCDDSEFAIDVPGTGIIATGDATQIIVARPWWILSDHPALAEIQRRVEQHGLVLFEQEQVVGDDPVAPLGPVLMSRYLPAAVRRDAPPPPAGRLAQLWKLSRPPVSAPPVSAARDEWSPAW